MTETPASTDPTIRDFPLSEGGEVEFRLGSNRLRIRGTDGDRVVIRGRTDRDLERELEIASGPGWVRVVDGPAGSFRLGPLTMRSGGGRAPDLDVEVPRTARINARTISGDIEAVGIVGASRWTSASGDVRLAVDGGPVVIETVSGDALIEAGAPLAVTARTVSGNVRIRAPRVLVLDAATTSGDVTVEAALDEARHHSVSSVSGDVRLVTSSEVRVELQSVAGDLKASVPHRSEGARGRRTVIVGSGRVAVFAKTMSGDVLVRPGAADGAIPMPPPVEGTAPMAPHAWPSATPEPAAPAAEEPAAPTADAMPVVPAADTELGDAAAHAAPEAAVLLDDTTVVPAPGREDLEAARLAILRALERGELDVEAASERLAAIEDVAAARTGD